MERPSGRVLVVEDNEANRRLAVRQLGVLGYDALAVDGGEAALEALSAGGIALVLMDCQMPVMDGFDTTRAIRRAEGSGSHVPIVAMTANATEHDRRRCEEAGMDDFTTKPVHLEALRDVLAGWLGPSTHVPASTSADPLERLAEEVGEEAASRFVARFLEELPARTAAVLVAIENADPEALAFAAHTLKSTSATVGADTLARLCDDLEARGRAGTTEGAASEAPLLVTATEETERTLRARERT